MDNPDIVFALTGDLYRNIRAVKQIRALSSAGFSVTVLTLRSDAAAFELPAGIRVDAVEVNTSDGIRFFRSVDVAFGRAAARIHARCFHASDLYVLSAMARAASFYSAHLTYDARELYPHVAATVRRPWVRWYWTSVEKRNIRAAEVVFTVSGLIAEHLVRMYRINRPVVILNVPPRSAITPSGRLRELAGIDEITPLILHLGQMRRSRGCEMIIRAMLDVPRAHLVFLGYGPERNNLQQLVQNLGLTNRITFLDAVPPEEVPSIAAGADVGVTLLEDTCLNHRYALPNKLFEYMAASVPILASDLPEIRSVVRGYDLGLTVDPSNRESVAAALRKMTEHPDLRTAWRANAATAAETFNWESASHHFIDAMRSVIRSA